MSAWMGLNSPYILLIISSLVGFRGPNNVLKIPYKHFD